MSLLQALAPQQTEGISLYAKPEPFLGPIPDSIQVFKRRKRLKRLPKLIWTAYVAWVGGMAAFSMRQAP